MQGKLRQAVQSMTEREGGGVLMGNEIDTKLEQPVLDVLIFNYPWATIHVVKELEDYPVVRTLVVLGITCNTMEKVTKKMSGAAGPSGVEDISLHFSKTQFNMTYL